MLRMVDRAEGRVARVDYTTLQPAAPFGQRCPKGRESVGRLKPELQRGTYHGLQHMIGSRNAQVPQEKKAPSVQFKSDDSPL